MAHEARVAAATAKGGSLLSSGAIAENCLSLRLFVKEKAKTKDSPKALEYMQKCVLPAT